MPILPRTLELQLQITIVELLRGTDRTLEEIAKRWIGITETEAYGILCTVPGWDSIKCPCGLLLNHEGRCWWYFYNHKDAQPKRGVHKKCSTCVLYLKGGVGLHCRGCWLTSLTVALFPLECPTCGENKKTRYSYQCKTCARRDAENNRRIRTENQERGRRKREAERRWELAFPDSLRGDSFAEIEYRKEGAEK
jgi:hypothetical protein